MSNEDFDNISYYDISFFTEYLLSYGVHGNSNNKTSHQAVLHEKKFKYLFSRLFLINKYYRKSCYPKLGKYLICYPVFLIFHCFFLLKHNFSSGLKFIFGKNNNKKIPTSLWKGIEII